MASRQVSRPASYETSQEADSPDADCPDTHRALVRAAWSQRLPDEWSFASITEMVAAERIEQGYLGSLMWPTLLAPGILETVLKGWKPQHLDLPRWMRSLCAEWEQELEIRV